MDAYLGASDSSKPVASRALLSDPGAALEAVGDGAPPEEGSHNNLSTLNGCYIPCLLNILGAVRTAWRAGPPEGIRPDHEHCADGESRAGVFDVSRLLLRRIRPCCSAYMIWLRTQRC